MPYDRAGYLNEYDNWGNNNREHVNSEFDRLKDHELLKKELHYIETYARDRDYEHNKFCKDRANSNCGQRGCNNGWNSCGNDWGCGNDWNGCGNDWGCSDNWNGCGNDWNGCGNDWGNGCGNNWGNGCGNNWGNGRGNNLKKDRVLNDKPRRIEKQKEKKINENDPCNPFCVPCYKPVCNEPKYEPCKCNKCTKSYDKIWN